MTVTARISCHVCGSRTAVKQSAAYPAPTCPRNECQLAAAGIISRAQARLRLVARGAHLR